MCSINPYDHSYFCSLVWQPEVDTWVAHAVARMRRGCQVIIKAEELEEMEPLIKYKFKFDSTLQRTIDVGWIAPPLELGFALTGVNSAT